MRLDIFKVMLVIFFVVSVFGCATPVTFYDSAEAGSSIPSENIIRVYVDAFGNIYPQESGISNFKSNGGSHSVYDQFRSNKALCKEVSRKSSPYIYEHCSELKNNGFQGWVTAQDNLWLATGESIYDYAKGRSIIFLIHGYNNDAREAGDNFEILRGKINKNAPGKNYLFVEIFWDGFKGNPVSGAWGKAQSSGPLVGFHMRKLFKGMTNKYRQSEAAIPEITIITHSSGAFVAAALLGDPYSALPDLQDPPENSPLYRLFNSHRADTSGSYPIPNIEGIRLGMIAAATPWNTFTGHKVGDKDVVDGILAPSTKLIFTLNYKDTALQKYFHLASLNMLGATNAGAKPKVYCRNLREVKGIESTAFDFSDGGFLIWNSHGVKGYMDRVNSDNFIKAVLGIDIINQYVCN